MKLTIKHLLLIAVLFTTNRAAAQSFGSSVATFDPPAAQYFFNQYIANPAMAGLDSGLHLNIAYRRPWDDIPGAPVTQSFTADGNVGKRVGLGANVMHDKAGLLQRTKVALTYAYHLPLNSKGSELHFGLSLALQVQRLNTKDINGDPNDPSLGAFNRRDNYFESDFGMAYTHGGLTIQAAVPDLIGHFRDQYKELSGSPTFFGAAAYRFNLGEQFNAVEPKICYRGVKDADDIIDAGVNLHFLGDRVNAFGMYHSSGSVSVGAGFNYRSTVAIQGVYVSQASGYRNILGNTFELNLQVNLFR